MAHCYLIEAENGMAKVGYAFNPEYRFTQIRGHSPIRVRLIAMWPAPSKVEGELHRKFEKFRSHSEWFRIEGEFAQFVDELRGKGVRPEQLEWNWKKPVGQRRLKPAEFFSAVMQ